MNEGQVKDFIREMNSNINNFQTETDSVGQQIDRLSEDVLASYNKLFKEPITSGREESKKNRDKQAAFASTLQQLELAQEKEEIDILEERIRSSDLLLLNYLLVTDEAYNGAKEILQEQDRSVAETSSDEIFEIMAKVCVEMMKKQREKNMEADIYKYFPDAPTTGQELEYPDPVLMIACVAEVIEESIVILESLIETGDFDPKEIGLPENFTNLVTYKGMSPEELKGKLEDFKSMNLSLAEARKALRDVDISEFNLKDVERDVKVLLITKTLGLYQSEEELPIIVKFLKGLRPIKKGDELSPADIKILANVSPTVTRMMSRTRAFDDKRELKGREYISKPSLTMKSQLRDVLNTLKSGGLGKEVNIHQTVSGAELSPENVDFMEAHLISIASGLDLEEYSETDINYLLLFLRKNIPAMKGDFQKLSVINDQKYLFPQHLNRGVSSEEAITYPDSSRDDNLLELRAVGVLKSVKDFPKYVKNTTFNWLCAWGAKAEKKSTNMRNDDEVYFVETYRELIDDWRKLLAEHGIDRPPENRYYCLEDQIGTEEGELYTRYKAEIVVRRYVERKIVESGAMKYEDTLEYKAKKLMINFRAKMNERIRNRIKGNAD